jgi:hypothetical protein
MSNFFIFIDESIILYALSGLLIAELLGQPDEDSFGPADVAEPVQIFVLNHFSNELGALLAEPGYHPVNVGYREHDAKVTERVHRGSAVICDGSRGEKPRKLEPAVAIGGDHHGNFYTLIAQASNAASPFSFDHGTPFQFQAQLREKRDRVIEGFYHDPDIVHSNQIVLCHF